MTTLQQALLKIQPQAQIQAQAQAKIYYSTPQWVGYVDYTLTFGPSLKKVFLYSESDWNVSVYGGATMVADRRLRLSELPLPLGDYKTTRQCFGTCYCEENDWDASQCSSGWFEQNRHLIGVLLAPKGAKAPEIWRLVPDEIIQGHDRQKRSRDLRRWEEGMPVN